MLEAQGLPQMEGPLVVFKRDNNGRISGLALAPDSLRELSLRKVEVN